MKKVKVSIIFIMALALFITSCGGDDNSSDNKSKGLSKVRGLFSNETLVDADGSVNQQDSSASFDNACLEAAMAVEDAEMAMKRYKLSSSERDYLTVLELSKNLVFDFDSDNLTLEDRRKCARQKFMVDSMKLVVERFLETEISKKRLTLIEKEDCLIEEVTAYPVYLQRGVKLYIDLEMKGNKTTKFYNADSKRLLKTYQAKNIIHDSISIENTAFYLLEVTPNGPQYLNLSLKQSVNTYEQLAERHSVIVKTIDANAKDFRAKKYSTITLCNVFEEPRKMTLRSQFKSAFSGNHRSIVAVQVPTGANDIAYSLRIATNEKDTYCDGQFFNNMNSSYRQIKFLGLPVYESTSNKTSILRELLNHNRPVREEDAYCNLYVFNNADMARRFQNKEVIDKLKYDVDYSTIGTQSCNGRIPCKGMKTIYLGFENERSTKAVYLWLEVIATVPATQYSMEQYSLE